MLSRGSEWNRWEPHIQGLVRIVLPELLAALEQVVQTGLVQSVEAAIRSHPSLQSTPS